MRFWANPCAAFLRSKDHFGAFQNMCGGMPLIVYGVRAQSSEALYQALKFVDSDDQAEILRQSNGFAAKQAAKALIGYRDVSELDTVDLMEFVLRVKLRQHPDILVPLMRESAAMPIVEVSFKDSFWGAKPVQDGFVGTNMLGQIWMALRKEAQACDWRVRDMPIAVPEAVLMNRYIDE